MGHAEGVCHVFIDKDCDNKKARRIAIDAKVRKSQKFLVFLRDKRVKENRQA